MWSRFHAGIKVDQRYYWDTIWVLDRPMDCNGVRFLYFQNHTFSDGLKAVVEAIASFLILYTSFTLQTCNVSNILINLHEKESVNSRKIHNLHKIWDTIYFSKQTSLFSIYSFCDYYSLSSELSATCLRWVAWEAWCCLYSSLSGFCRMDWQRHLLLGHLAGRYTWGHHA